MEQEQKEAQDKISKDVLEQEKGIDLDKYVESLLLHLKELERKVLEFEKVKEYKNTDYLNRVILDFKLKTEKLKGYYNSFSQCLKDILDSKELSELVSLSDKLNALAGKIQKFSQLFAHRKQVSDDFLKKIDYIIMNEAIKNEMVSHIFDMLNRGESKEKVMIASLEFVYFLKEIESDETLNELKELKNLIITMQREESNTYHFLEKLREKILEFSKIIDIPIKKLDDFKKNADEVKSQLQKIISDIKNVKEESGDSKGNQ